MFAKFLYASFLKSAIDFTKGHPQYGNVAQIKTIHSCLHHFSVNHFKPVQPTIVSTLCQNTVHALVEENIFLAFMENDKWPVELEILPDNLLRMSTMDTRQN